jgi:hypothetical protein
MKRSSFIVLVALFTAASAWAAVSPTERTALDVTGANVTVIEKNQAFPLVGPLEVEECLNDDCTLTRI